LVLAALTFNSLHAQPQYVDCRCLTNQAAAVLTTNACIAYIPDLCQFTNCFQNVVPPVPLSCSQSPAAGTQVGPGTHAIIVTVTDPNGVGSQCVVNFTVTGVSSGQFALLCASNKTVSCDQPWSFDPPTPTNYCCPQPGTPNNGVTIVVVSTTTNGTCPAMITQTWQGTDACGQTATCSQTVTVVDNVPPVITCAPNQTYPCGTAWAFGFPSATDNCTAASDLSYAVISTTTNFGCGETYVASQVWEVHDLCGNKSSCTQMVAVVDTVAPTIICANDKTVECSSQWSFDPPVAYDNCGNAALPPTNVTVTVLSTVTNGFCPQRITRTWMARDGCGNSSTCTQMVTVVDTTPPVLDCNCLRDPAVVQLNVVGCSNAIPDLCKLIAQCATDNCGPLTCSQNPPAGTIVTPGTYPITVTVYDCASNSAMCVVNFVLTPPPGGCTPCTNQVRVWNTGMGGVNGNVVLAPGTPDPNYTLVSLPSGSCTGPAQVVNPGTIPGVWVPNGPNSQWIGGGPTVYCNGGVYRYRVTFVLECTDGAAIVGQWTADDWAEMYLNGQPTGHTVPSVQNPNQSFAGWHPVSITNGFICGTNYLDLVVTNAYTFDNPTGLRAELTNFFNDCCCTAQTTLFNVASGLDPNTGAFLPSGAPDNQFSLTCAPPGVSVTTPVVIDPNFIPSVWVPNGPNSVWIGPDQFNNAPAGTYCYTLTFNIPCPPGKRINASLTGRWTADDSGAIFLNGNQVSTNLPQGWSFTNWHGINITSGFVPGVNTLTFMVTNWGGPTGLRLELAGTASCCDCTNQTCAISIECPTNITVVTCSSNAVVNYPPPNIINPCGSNVSYVCIPPSGSTFPLGTNTVTCFVGDATGVIYSQCNFDVIVEPCVTNTCVSIQCTNDVTVQTCSGGTNVTYAPPTATSSCGTAITNVTCTPPSGSFFPLGTTTVTCTATDAQGNSASCSFQVIVTGDTTPPNCPPFSMSVTGCPPRMPNFQTNGLVTDNCTPSGSITVSQNIPPGTPLTPGSSTVVILTICDAAGNCRVCDVQITAYSSGVPPKIKCPKDITVITCSNSATVKYKVSANVPAAFVHCTPPSGSIFPLGTNMVTCTATNACGEGVSCSFKVIVKYGLSVNPTVTITAGLPDNFAPNVEPSPPSACMISAFSGYSFWKGFDSNAANVLFGHRFTGLPANIIQAELIIRMRPMNDSGADNDGLFIGLPSSCAPGSWTYLQSIKALPGASPATGGTWIGTSNGPTTFTLNLGALNPAFIPKLNADGFLDVVVHDDTTVDFMRLRLWTCPPKHPGIGIPFDVVGGATIAQRGPSLDDPATVGPMVPALCIVPNPNSPQSGVLLSPGTPQKMTFTTELPFDAPDGATFEMALPTEGDPVNPFEPLLTFHKSAGPPTTGWNMKVNVRGFVAADGMLNSVAVGTNGHLFPSLSTEGSEPDLEDFIQFSAQPGVTSMMVTVTLDCDTREVSFEIPECLWTQASGRKGWDGCIYGNPRPPKATSAKLVLTPNPPLVPRLRIGTVPLALLASGLAEIGLENPTVTSQGRKWGDGHVTLMKAYDDEEDAAMRRMEWTSFGEGGGVHVDLGRAATFELGLHHFENGDVPTQEQFLRVIRPPRGLTNRPTPPKDIYGFRQNAGGGVECSVDYSDVGATGVRVELWREGTLVGFGEGPGPIIPPDAPLTISRWPERYGRPAINEGLFLRSSELFEVSGLLGDEIRIIPLLPSGGGAKVDGSPGYVTGLEIQTAEGMESTAYGLQRTLACVPDLLHVTRSDTGTVLTWAGEGFRLQGAETVTGPWYDLGVASPVPVEASSAMRYFRLVCD